MSPRITGYISRMSLVPGILEAIIILVTVYALGSELKYGTSKHLLEKTGGSMSAALLGKTHPVHGPVHGHRRSVQSRPVRLGRLPHGRVCLEHDARDIPAGPCLRVGSDIHHRHPARAEACDKHFRPLLRARILSRRIHLPCGSHAWRSAGGSPPCSRSDIIICCSSRKRFSRADSLAGMVRAVSLLLFMALPPLVYRRLQKAYVLLNYPRN